MGLVFKGRIAISGGTKIEGQPLERYLVGGVFVSLEGQPVTKTDGWEMIECEIILKPSTHYRKVDDSLKNARVDQVIQVLSEDNMWGDKESPKPNTFDELN